MKCPYCGKPMEYGSILGGRQKMSWTPDGEHQPWIGCGKSKNGVHLGTYNYWTGGRVDACYCRDCNKVIIDP